LTYILLFVNYIIIIENIKDEEPSLLVKTANTDERAVLLMELKTP
jgi:hypothetical protein